MFDAAGDTVASEARSRPSVRHHRATAQKTADFLSALEETGDVEEACEISGLSHSTAYYLRHANHEFASAWRRIVPFSKKHSLELDSEAMARGEIFDGAFYDENDEELVA